MDQLAHRLPPERTAPASFPKTLFAVVVFGLLLGNSCRSPLYARTPTLRGSSNDLSVINRSLHGQVNAAISSGQLSTIAANSSKADLDAMMTQALDGDACSMYVLSLAYRNKPPTPGDSGQVDPEFWLERSAKSGFLYAIEDLASKEIRDQSPGEWSDLAIAHRDRWIIQRLATFWDNHAKPADDLYGDWARYYALSMVAGDLGCASCREDAERFLSNRSDKHYGRLHDGLSDQERVASLLPQYRAMLGEPASQACPYFDPLSQEQLNKLLSSGVSQARVMAILRQRGITFNLDKDSINSIRRSGGNDEVIVNVATQRHTLGCDDIILLLQAGVNQKVLIQAVKARSTSCSLTPSESQSLREVGASNELMLAIVQHH